MKPDKLTLWAQEVIKHRDEEQEGVVAIAESVLLMQEEYEEKLKAMAEPTDLFAEFDGTVCCKACGVGGIEEADRYCFHCGRKLRRTL